MLANYLEGKIMFLENVNTWEEAIRYSAQPLLEGEYITKSYVDAMIENVNQNGPYIVIMPEIAMPHARNEKGALKTGITFLLLDEPVMFPENKPVKILMALSSESDDGHLEMLGELGSALIDEDVVGKLKHTTNAEEVISIIKSVEE